MIKKSKYLILLFSLLLFTHVNAQTIPNGIKDLGRRTNIDYFQYTENSDTAFYLGWYLTLEKHPQAFQFLDASIVSAQNRGDQVGANKLKSLKAQKLRDLNGEKKPIKATVIKKIIEQKPTPKPEIIAPAVEIEPLHVFHQKRIDAGTANKEELIESHEYLADYYGSEEKKQYLLQVENLEAILIIYQYEENTEKTKEYHQKVAFAQTRAGINDIARINHQIYIDGIKDEVKKIKTIDEIGDYYFEKDLYENSLYFKEKLLEIGEKKQIDSIIIDANNDIGSIFQVLGIKEKAFQNHQEALKLSDAINNNLRIAQSHIKLGILNASIKQFETAEDNLDTALAIALENGYDKELVDIYNEKANLCLVQKRPKAAIENINLCNEILEKIGDKNRLIINLNTIGDINYDFNFIPEAKDSYQRSINLALETQKQSLLSMNYADYGKILLSENKSAAAMDSCFKGYNIAKNIKYLEFKANNCKCLHLASKKEKQFEKSVNYLEEFTAVKDSLFNIAKLKQVSKLQARYEFEKQIVAKDYSIQLLEEQNNKRNILFGLLALLAMFLIFGLTLLSKNLREKNKYNNELFELNDELKSMNYQQLQNNQKLVEANKVLENFAAVAAHDLKVPLRSISSFSEMLLRKNKDKFDEKDKEYFGFIAKDSERLQNMVTSLLAFSKIGKNLPPTEYINLNDVCDAVVQRLQVKINEKNAMFDIGLLRSVNVNQPLIEQLFQNIISNSLKFQKKHNIARIVIEGKEVSNGNFYQVSITDNGIGIDKENIENVFELFSRMNNRSEFSGNGIGLATCKRIVEHYGGEISISSIKNRGTTVTFTLPL